MVVVFQNWPLHESALSLVEVYMNGISLCSCIWNAVLDKISVACNCSRHRDPRSFSPAADHGPAVSGAGRNGPLSAGPDHWSAAGLNDPRALD